MLAEGNVPQQAAILNPAYAEYLRVEERIEVFSIDRLTLGCRVKRGQQLKACLGVYALDEPPKNKRLLFVMLGMQAVIATPAAHSLLPSLVFEVGGKMRKQIVLWTEPLKPELARALGGK